MLLMEEAERIARDEHGSEKIAVISGKQTLLYRDGVKTRDKMVIEIELKLKCVCVWGGGGGGGGI